MATLLDDLEDRGLLRNTLVVTLAEFGRTPSDQLDAGPRPLRLGVEHDAVGLRHPRRHGVSAEPTRRANASSTARSNAARLFATIYRALGINPHKNYYVGSRPIPLVDAGTEPIREVLA